MTARRTAGSLAVITLAAGLVVAPDPAGAVTARNALAHSTVDAHAQRLDTRLGTRAATVGPGHMISGAPQAKIVGAEKARRRAVFVQFAGTGAAMAFRTTLHTTPGARASRDAAAQRAALARRAAVRRTAAQVFAAASAVDPSARKLWEVGNALPGMAVIAGPRAIAAIAARSDVVKVSTLVPKRPADANTAALTRALDTWSDPGMTGRGVTVGVIDTGLDYTHADFGGVGTTTAYDAALADDTDPAWQAALPALAQAKIAGGVDLAGDAYDAGSTTSDVPTPDSNPLDCSGHGTHVAGTIAGYGVNGDGTTFSTDDYAGLDENALLSMDVGPGIAPDAQLYPLKIFGCSGSSDLLIPALNRALDPDHDGNFDDHLDIVDIALTSDYATPDDPDNAEVNAVADAGVLPVVAIGNGGDTTDVGGAPASATRALAVASSIDSYQLRDGLQVTSPSGVVTGDVAEGQDARSYSYPDGAVSGAVVTMPDDNGNPTHDNADGCNTFNGSQRAAVNGKIVWLEWDDNAVSRRCDAQVRSANAHAAGATGVLFGSGTPVFSDTLSTDPALPVFQVGDSDTSAMRSAALSGNLAVAFDPALHNTMPTQDDSLSDTLSAFSSRGPHGSLGVVKPDVTAPGDTIASAGMGTGSGVSVESGTSMAAAHVAGLAALVDQAHPGWSAEELKAAVMNTADHDIHVTDNAGSAAYAPTRVGAGRIDAHNAVTTPLLAFNNDVAGGVSASFGVVTAPANVTSMTRSQVIKVENTGDTDESANVAYVAAVTEPGVKYSIQGLADDGTLTVHAHTSQLITITITVRSSALRHTIDPTMTRQTALGDGLPAQNRQYVSDASGRLIITPTDTTLPALRVPVYGAARPASTLTAEGGTDEILRSGTSFTQGPSPEDNTNWTSFAVPMSLDATSKQLPACTGSVTRKCTANKTAEGGDIRYVGSGSFPGKSHGKPSLANGYFYIGISTYADNATLGHAVQPYALIYLKGHKSPDYESYVADLPGTDLLLNNVLDLKTGHIVDQEFVNWEDGSVDTNVFDTNTVIMPIWLAALGVNDKTKTLPLKFTVGEASRYAVNADGDIDSVGPVSVDAVAPEVAVGVTPGLVPLFDGNGPLPADVTQPHTKALVFFLHNPDDRVGDNPDVDRDQVVKVDPRPTAMSIHVPPSVEYGHDAEISGTLRHKSGAAIGKATVALAAREPGESGYQVVATAKTTRKGAVSVRTHPKKNTTYRWQWAGGGGNSAVKSPARTVSVHQVVTIAAKPASVAHDKPFQLYGTTTPLVSGARVRIQQRTQGRWRTIKTITTSEQQLPDGVYEAGYKLRRTEKSAGSYSFRATWRATGGRDSGTSKILLVTVR